MVNQEVIEGLQTQSAEEEIIYKITTTNWGSNPTNVSTTAFDETVKEVCTNSAFPENEPTVDGDIISLSPLKSLIKNRTYKIEVKFKTDGNVFECFFRVGCPM